MTDLLQSDWYGALTDADARHAPDFERQYGERPAKCELTFSPRADGLFFHMQERVWKVVHGGVEQARTFPREALGEAEKFARGLRA